MHEIVAPSTRRGDDMSGILVQVETPAEHCRNALQTLRGAEVDATAHIRLTAAEYAGICSRLHRAIEQLETPASGEREIARSRVAPTGIGPAQAPLDYAVNDGGDGTDGIEPYSDAEYTGL